MEIDVSIVIISYNYGNWLSNALGACARQTLKNIEIIAINNGSSDDTEDVFFEFHKNNPQILFKYVKIENNNGLPPARNIGLEMSSGEFVMFNDADDYMTDDCLEKLVGYAKKNNFDRVIGGYQNFSTDGKLRKKIIYPQDTSRWLLNDLQANIFRKSIFTSNNIVFPSIYFDDYGVSMDFNLFTDKVGYVEEVTYFRMINISSATNIEMGKSSNNPITYLREILMHAQHIVTKIETSEALIVKYHAIKMYYTIVLLYSRILYRAKQSKRIKLCHLELQTVLKEYDSEYLNNPLITLFKKNGNRFFGRMLIFWFSKFEKLGIFDIALHFYCFLTKYMVLDC